MIVVHMVPVWEGTSTPWDALTEVEHELCVTVPAWLLRLTPEDRVKFAEYLVWYAAQVLSDPEREAYSVS